jgi:hypothetical protein
LIRRGQTGAPKRIFEIRPEDTRKVEGTRQLEDTENDLRELKVKR